MSIEHVDISTGEIHEPKGAAASTVGQILTSTGGASAWGNLSDIDVTALSTTGASVGDALVADGSGGSSWGTPAPSGAVSQGVYDYNDVTTATTPIPLTAAATQYELTNDGAGVNTNTTYALSGISNLWDVATDRFDFTGLSLGDTVDIRFDVEFTTTTANTAVTLDVEFGVGATPYQIKAISEADKKAAGTYQVVVQTSFYMGNTLTRDNPARILASADKTGVTVKVNGWYIRPLHTN